MYDETAALTEAVTARIEQVLAVRLAQVRAVDERVGQAAGHLADLLRTGKRIRPRCCWWGYRAGGGGDPVHPDHRVVRVGAALELLQAAALIHDDIIDRSETRRGRPAVHRASAADHRSKKQAGDADHFGTSVAVLLGDLALAWADDEFTALGLGGLSADIWSAMRTEVLAGQLLDVIGAVETGQDAAEHAATAHTVIRYKTASYTIRRPLELGAACAGATREVREQLTEYGLAVGVAFQLRDDLLGIFGDPALTGKPAGGDLTEGKRTLLLGWAQVACDNTPDQLAVLDRALGSADPARLSAAAELIRTCGAAGRAEQEITALVAQAHRALAGITEPAATALRDLAAAATDRVS